MLSPAGWQVVSEMSEFGRESSGPTSGFRAAMLCLLTFPCPAVSDLKNGVAQFRG